MSIVCQIIVFQMKTISFNRMKNDTIFCSTIMVVPYTQIGMQLKDIEF